MIYKMGCIIRPVGPDGQEGPEGPLGVVVEASTAEDARRLVINSLMVDGFAVSQFCHVEVARRI